MNCDAIKRVWMEGYSRGVTDGLRLVRSMPPHVEITQQDLARVYESGICGCPECPCTKKATRDDQNVPSLRGEDTNRRSK